MKPFDQLFTGLVDSPTELRKLPKKELSLVVDGVRERMVDVVSRKGGHLGASLGATEIVVALHYHFNTPEDRIVWDVGHQAYAHKILTGRNEAFETLRQLGGLSGFPSRKESEYDTFGVGHSSTSLSAIHGMAQAAALQGKRSRNHIAVIGDGGLTAGLAFEGLNQLGESDLDVLVVLNDNRMSIDPNVGALQEYLNSIDSIGRPQNLFESLGFAYSGPIDGNDLDAVLAALDELDEQKGPKVLHCLTVKGKGYAPAEDGDQVRWHAPGLFHKSTGESSSTISKGIKYQDAFGNKLLQLMNDHPDIVAVTPAMTTGSGLNVVKNSYPDRTFDVGIAEQHAVTFSAGLAAEGLKPFCVIYSSFLQRAYDQLIHDVALQNLPVVFCIDRAGLVGEDGATHHGTFDLAMLKCIPNMEVLAPLDDTELHTMMEYALSVAGPVAIRYPRGNVANIQTEGLTIGMEKGRGRCMYEGGDVAVVTIGAAGKVADQLLNEDVLEFGWYDLRFAKPIDTYLLEHIFRCYGAVVTIEDGVIQGGIGESIKTLAQASGYGGQVINLGVPDEFMMHGKPDELQAHAGFDANSLREVIQRLTR